MKNGKTLAFDIGGTKIASAVVEISGSDYKILDYKKNDTPEGHNEIVAKILELFEFYKGKYNFKTIGFSIAGQINLKGDTVVYAPNIQSLDNFKLAKAIEQKTNCKVFVRNDVQCFALGEDRFGKHKECDNVIFIAIGTGIGGATKVNGKFYFGQDNIAGEFGHMVIVKDGLECACGRKGCWERYFSGPAMEEMYEKTYGQKKSAREIAESALRGEKKDKEFMIEASKFFTTGLSNLINILNPEIVILGGSMFKQKSILKFMTPYIPKKVLPSARKTKIVNSSLEEKAFLLGAVID
jgi:predicted NBD/HSP70 family sugar kinase